MAIFVKIHNKNLSSLNFRRHTCDPLLFPATTETVKRSKITIWFCQFFILTLFNSVERYNSSFTHSIAGLLASQLEKRMFVISVKSLGLVYREKA